LDFPPYFFLLFDFIPLFAALVPFLPAGGLLCARALQDVASASAHNIFAFDAIALDVFLSFTFSASFLFSQTPHLFPLSSTFQDSMMFGQKKIRQVVLGKKYI
jgi:hypothetical protein